MLREVDWTTLLFFIGLFIVVGGMEKTGAIEWLATRVAIIAGESVKRAALLTTWVAGIASGIVANIPFTVAALPVADFLTDTIPQAAESGIIYWGLILGADLGGNATILGSAPNIVALGLLGQAGFRLTFGRFLRCITGDDHHDGLGFDLAIDSILTRGELWKSFFAPHVVARKASAHSTRPSNLPRNEAHGLCSSTWRIVPSWTDQRPRS
jgi:hypothetical protein